MGRAIADPVELKIRQAFADLGSELLQTLRSETAKAERREETDRLLTINETADRLGISRQRVYRLIADGDLSLVKMGRYSRIRQSDVQRLVVELGGTAA